MTNHRDPIEDWLSRDIEVLPPPPGSFRRVRSRARRRKAIQAASAAAGVAVILAAGISVPALTGNLFPGGGAAKLPAPTATGPAASHRPTASPGARSLPGPGLSRAGRGSMPPAGFEPSSVTFVGKNPGYLGAVLGEAPCGGRTCTAMAGTANYGGTWTTVNAPPAGPLAVSQVRFDDPANGWAYGPALYATHDGGKSWRPVAFKAYGVAVVDLAAVGNRVFAVIVRGSPADCRPGSTAGCTAFTLYSAPVAGGRWTPVPGGSGSGAAVAGGLQLTPEGGYLVTGGRLYAGPVTGGGWHAVPASGARTPGCLSQPAASPRLIAAGQGTLYLACSPAGTTSLDLYTSGDGGRTWQALGTGPVPAGSATSLAVSPAGHLVLATTTGLYYSDTGQKWSRVTAGSAANLAFRYIGMTTATLGVAVPANPAAGELFVTRDGGQTWRAAPVSR